MELTFSLFAHHLGMVAYRYEGTGSIFVQNFCQVLSKHAANLEMSQILTRVSSIDHIPLIVLMPNLIFCLCGNHEGYDKNPFSSGNCCRKCYKHSLKSERVV